MLSSVDLDIYRWGGAKREGSDWDGVQPLRGYLALGYVGGGQKPERA